MRRDPGHFGGLHVSGNDVERLAQRALDAVRLRHPALALLADGLPLEPRKLTAQMDDFTLLRVEQSAHLRRAQSHCRTGDFGRGMLIRTHVNIIMFLQCE